MKSFVNAVYSGTEQSSSDKHGHQIIKFQLSDFVMLSEHTIAINKRVSVKHINHSAALITSITEVFTPPPDLILKNKT